MSAEPGGARRGRPAAPLVAAAVGGFLLRYSGRRGSDDALAFAGLVAGAILLAGAVSTNPLLLALELAHRRPAAGRMVWARWLADPALRELRRGPRAPRARRMTAEAPPEG